MALSGVPKSARIKQSGRKERCIRKKPVTTMTDLLENSDCNLFHQESHLQQNIFKESDIWQLSTPLQNRPESVQQNLSQSQQSVIN